MAPKPVSLVHLGVFPVLVRFVDGMIAMTYLSRQQRFSRLSRDGPRHISYSWTRSRCVLVTCGEYGADVAT